MSVAARVIPSAASDADAEVVLRIVRPSLEDEEPAPIADAALEVRGLTQVYRGPHGESLTALSDVDFAIQRGEFVSIVGPSGCGKTTLLRVLADLQAPTSGEARVLGESPRQSRLERKYSFVFQRPVLFEWRSVLDNVTLPLEVSHASKSERRERALGALRLCGLERFASYAPWQLSAGMQQRVGLARALVTQPAVLLMDEPFGALDAQTRQSMHELLQQIWMRDRKTVVFVTHNVREALVLGDRVVVMAGRPGRAVITQTRSARSSASSMSWVTNSTVW